MKKTKFEIIKEALLKGDEKTALQTAKGFFYGLPPELKRNIEIAAECMAGKESFYISLGVDTVKAKTAALDGLRSKYI